MCDFDRFKRGCKKDKDSEVFNLCQYDHLLVCSDNRRSRRERDIWSRDGMLSAKISDPVKCGGTTHGPAVE